MDILTCSNRTVGLQITMSETLRDGVYSLTVREKTGEDYNMVALCTDNFEHGLEVYRELECHVLAGDRNYTELCGMVCSKLAKS